MVEVEWCLSELCGDASSVGESWSRGEVREVVGGEVELW